MTDARLDAVRLGLLVALVLPPAEAQAALSGFSNAWVAKPTDEELAAVLPPGVPGGRAVMQCAVGDDGALSGCRVVRETPSGSGVGQALLSLAPKFKRRPPGAVGMRQINVVNDWYHVDTPPEWARRPTAGNLKGVYPRHATGISGYTIISCIVDPRGALSDCVPTEEMPSGAGFGAAAVMLRRYYYMKPAKLGGVAVTSSVGIPTYWGRLPAAR